MPSVSKNQAAIQTPNKERRRHNEQQPEPEDYVQIRGRHNWNMKSVHSSLA